MSYPPKARGIVFSHTSKELLSRKKTCTRRVWKDRTVLTFTRYFNNGSLIPCYDKSPRNGGKKIALIKLTAPLTREALIDMPIEDLEAEGGMCQTVTEFGDRYFNGNLNLEVIVIRFTLIKIISSHEPTTIDRTRD